MTANKVDVLVLHFLATLPFVELGPSLKLISLIFFEGLDRFLVELVLVFQILLYLLVTKERLVGEFGTLLLSSCFFLVRADDSRLSGNWLLSLLRMLSFGSDRSISGHAFLNRLVVVFRLNVLLEQGS